MPERDFKPEATGGAGPPDDLPLAIREQFDMLRRPALCPLFTDQSLAGLLDGKAVAGEVSIRGQRIPFNAIMTAENPPSFELQAPGLPAGYRPVCIVLGQFDFPQVAPVQGSFAAPFVVLERREGAQSADMSAAHQLAADTATGESILPLAKGAGLGWSFDPTMSRLEVTTWDDLEHRDQVVAELAGVDDAGQPTSQRRLVTLPYRLSDGRQKGLVNFERVPFRAGSEVRITVRGLTANDLDLLSSQDTIKFLGEQDFVTLPIEKSANGFAFRARWSDQQEMIAERSTSWLLQIAVPEEEANS